MNTNMQTDACKPANKHITNMHMSIKRSYFFFPFYNKEKCQIYLRGTKLTRLQSEIKRTNNLNKSKLNYQSKYKSRSYQCLLGSKSSMNYDYHLSYSYTDNTHQKRQTTIYLKNKVKNRNSSCIFS